MKAPRWLVCRLRGHAWTWRFYYYPPADTSDRGAHGEMHMNRDCHCCGAFEKEESRTPHWNSATISYVGKHSDGSNHLADIRARDLEHEERIR